LKGSGALLATPGAGFEVSTDTFNPYSVLFDFGDINFDYVFQFEPYTQERMFTPRGSTTTDINFVLPGTNTPALTTGFGAVFSDVNVDQSTWIEYFDVNGNSLGKFYVPAVRADEHENFGFLGVDFNQAIVARVRINSGNIILGPNVYENDIFDDLVVMDNFIYGPLVEAGNPNPNTVPEPGSRGILFASLTGFLGLGWMKGNKIFGR